MLAEIVESGVGSKWTPTERRNFLERKIELQSGSAGWTTLRKQFKQPLLILMTVVGLVLAVACINVANLLLARAAMRQKEIITRLALGAGRLRLVRQLLTESVLLAIIGGSLGLLFAQWGARLLLAYLPGHGNLALNLQLDLRVFGFTLAVSVLTGHRPPVWTGARATHDPARSCLDAERPVRLFEQGQVAFLTE
jgi:ABC-type lipoprotein release transport system permease subunit